MNCINCEEPIDPAELARVQEHTPFMQVHADCLLRLIAGSVGHQLGQCACFGGRGNGDLPGLTVRENARAAAALFRQRRVISTRFKVTPIR